MIGSKHLNSVLLALAIVGVVLISGCISQPELPRPIEENFSSLEAQRYRVQYPENWYWQESDNKLNFFIEAPETTKLPLVTILPMNEIEGYPIPWNEGPDFQGESTFLYDTPSAQILCRGNGICIQLNRFVEENTSIPQELLLKILFSAEYIAPRPQPQQPQKPEVCIELYDPVCGEDGKTYSNECFANITGVKVKYKGECVTTVSLPPPLPGYPTTPQGTAFQEDFTGSTPNERLWEINDGYKYWDSFYDASKTSVNNGVLRLAMNSNDKTSDNLLKVGGIKSNAFYSYGNFTFRAKSNPAKGTVSALFLYNEDKDMTEGGTHEEIDVELSSKFPCQASLVTYHKDDWTSSDLGLQNEMHRGGIKNLCSISGLEDFDSRIWNEYVIDWMPGKVIWYVNGIKVEEFTNAVPTTPMHFSLDTYNSKDWDAFIDTEPAGEGAVEVDYISYTPYE